MVVRRQTEADIKHLDGVDAVRAKPGMYIGHPDSFALWTLCRELGDNAVDEFLADRNTSVHIINDGSYMWCLDSGDGVPVGVIKVKTHGHVISMPAIEAIFGMTHTGGKMVASEDGAYSGSRGTHGIGATATNAMSSHFQVWTKRDGVWYTCSFEKGHLSEKLSVVRTLPKLPFGLRSPRKGTLVRFKPDLTLFDKGSKLKDTDVEQWCEITSYLNGGFKVSYTNASGNTKDWYSENGSEDYLTHLLETAKATALGDYVLFSDKQIDLALAFTDYDGVDLRGYTNGLYNSDGGLHVQAVFKALSDTLMVYKTAKQTFTGVDLREGIIGIVNFKIAAPAFSSQTKEKLIDERVKEPCYETVYEVFESYFKTHKALAKKICDRVQELRTLKNEFADNKRVLKELKTPVGKRSNLPSKLVPSIGGIPADRELFIVEGDSAGGCFNVATTVKCLEGNLTFGELVSDFSLGIDHIGYAWDTTNRTFVLFKFEHPRITKYIEELLELTFDTGSIVQCTPDHLWLLETGYYKRADQLTDSDVIRQFQQPLDDVDM